VNNLNWETKFYGYNRSIYNHGDIIGLQSCRIRWKKTPNNGYCAV